MTFVLAEVPASVEGLGLTLSSHCKNSGRWAEGRGSGSLQERTQTCSVKLTPSNCPNDAGVGAPSGGDPRKALLPQAQLLQGHRTPSLREIVTSPRWPAVRELRKHKEHKAQTVVL